MRRDSITVKLRVHMIETIHLEAAEAQTLHSKKLQSSIANITRIDVQLAQQWCSSLKDANFAEQQSTPAIK